MNKNQNTLAKIVNRAKEIGVPGERIDIAMDIDCAIKKNPVDLERLLGADEFNFAHDVCGIIKHLNRGTGKLENHFRPRFSV